MPYTGQCQEGRIYGGGGGAGSAGAQLVDLAGAAKPWYDVRSPVDWSEASTAADTDAAVYSMKKLNSLKRCVRTTVINSQN